ncbi:TPA: plasmid recombination protein, partial [Bacillus paranthracis]|nr:plasmid recombination protein [Bacillus paranthracis]
KKDYERLQTTDLVQENKNLREEVYQKTKENRKLMNQVETLNTEISSLKAHIGVLKENVRVLYQQTKKVFKEQFKAFRGLIKNELDMKKIDNQFEREHKKELKTRQRGYDMER